MKYKQIIVFLDESPIIESKKPRRGRPSGAALSSKAQTNLKLPSSATPFANAITPITIGTINDY